MNFYSYTDKALKYLRRYYIREFNRAKMQIRIDRLNVVGVTTGLYERIASETERVFAKIAKWKYREICDEDFIVDMWLSGFLCESNPLTGYIWKNDIDRKRQYFTESILSGENIDDAAKKALRYWYGSQRQYADLVTDAAAIEGFQKLKVKFVEWVTAEDEKVCAVCNGRNGKIYPVRNVPRKPHYNCRCYLRRV